MSDGYFSPDSAIRRIGREAVLMLGGGRALLMQAAHPLVAAGIVEHSHYADEPWRRLARTMTMLYTIVFGTKVEADRAGAAVRAVHERVGGRLAERVGRYAAGTRYAASDPDLMLWVHSTLVDTGVVMYETYVGQLSADDREAFFREMNVVAEVFGTPRSVLPATFAEFEDYRRAMVSGGELAVGPPARAVASVVLDPPVPAALKPAFRALRPTTIGLLPESLRDQYGLRWGGGRGRVLATSAGFARSVLVPLLPPAVRVVKADDGPRSGVPLRVLAAFAQSRA